LYIGNEKIKQRERDMKLKRILENFIMSADHIPPAHPDTAAHHTFQDASHVKHDAPAADFSTIQHHHITADQAKDPSVYYVQKPESGMDFTSLPKEKIMSDVANFKVYDANHDGILDQKDLGTLLGNLSKEYKVPLNVIQAIINHESGWDPNAKHNNPNSQDIGLMQLNSKYIPDYVSKYWDHKDIKFDARNPFHNAEVGVAYLADLHKQTNDNKWWEKTIMAYNIGPAAVNNQENLETGKKYLDKIATMMHTKKLGIPKGMTA
jgi:hypothetical protein